jgi:acetyltransferase-like isoleucine patch superfamily enzyme
MFRRWLKVLYQIYFSFAKYFIYPNCIVRSNFILPGVKLGRGVIIFEGCKIYSNVEIGDHTFINEHTRIDPNTTSIGKYCSISHGVKIGLGPHPLTFVSTSPVFYSPSRGYVTEKKYDEFAVKGYTEIGHDVFIAANAIILAGVKVGTGAVVTASSVVVKDVPPYAVVSGNPAKILKYRFQPDEIEKLLASQWWLKSPEELLRQPDAMTSIQNFLKIAESIK